MDITKGLLYINGVDVYDKYGAFLTEDADGKYTNYSELLTPPRTKPYISVNFREENGEKLPDVLPSPTFEARDVSLYFAILAGTPEVFIAKYYDFVNFLKSGWLEIRLPELKKTYKMYYMECSEYEQLTPIEGQIVAKFKVKFREPNPSF
jgi:hypothetical protein